MSKTLKEAALGSCLTRRGADYLHEGGVHGFRVLARPFLVFVQENSFESAENQ